MCGSNLAVLTCRGVTAGMDAGVWMLTLLTAENGEAVGSAPLLAVLWVVWAAPGLMCGGFSSGTWRSQWV